MTREFEREQEQWHPKQKSYEVQFHQLPPQIMDGSNHNNKTVALFIISAQAAGGGCPAVSAITT